MRLIKKINIKQTADSLNVDEAVTLHTSEINVSSARVACVRLGAITGKRFSVNQQGSNVTITRTI